MLFSINEDGDLGLEKDMFSDFVFANEQLTNFRITKTLLISQLVYKNWFEKNFLLNKRVFQSNDEIKKIIDEKLSQVFHHYPELLKDLEYNFTLDNGEFNIVFSKFNGYFQEVLLTREIII